MAEIRVRQARLVAYGPDQPEKERLLLAFGQGLKSLRGAAGLSQQELAARCFMRHDHISSLERGRRTPNLNVLLMLAHALEASVAELADGLDAPTRIAGRAQVLALVRRQPGISTKALADSLGLPTWYLDQIVRRLDSFGEIVPQPSGWQLAFGQAQLEER